MTEPLQTKQTVADYLSGLPRDAQLRLGGRVGHLSVQTTWEEGQGRSIPRLCYLGSTKRKYIDLPPAKVGLLEVKLANAARYVPVADVLGPYDA